jgi:ribosomal 50S subunit-associated protein YjgA (DUF615 family)
MIRQSDGKTRQVRILEIDDIFQSPENSKLYRPIDPADPDTVALAESLKADGQLEDLVVTQDRFLISGHRRHVAARRAGLRTLRCVVEPFRKDDDHDRFMRLLREHNRQRNKTNLEKLREELVSTNPEEAYEALIEARLKQAVVTTRTIRLRGAKERPRISAAKMPMLDAAVKVVEDLVEYWPLTVRLIHYELLNDPPLRHAKKPGSRYENDRASYQDLADLLARARLEGQVPWEAVTDETRPMTVWGVYQDVQDFIRDQKGDFLTGYYRDLLQSQPNHIEIIGEKNTLGNKLSHIAARYRIPMTLGRGYCCLDRRQKIAERYESSGKDRLVLLMLSDFDPDGEEIVHSFATSMRDDFGIDDIDPIKVALTHGQVKRFRLKNPQSTLEKRSPQAAKFVEKYGTDTYEIEALSPKRLEKLLVDAIDGVLNVDAFNYEVGRERDDAHFLAAMRNVAMDALRNTDFDQERDTW